MITNQIGSILKRKRSAGSTEGDGSSCTGGDIDKNNKKKKKIKKQKEKNHHHHHRHQDHCNSGGNHHDDEDKVDGGGGGGTTSSKKATTTPDDKYVQVKASGGIITMSTIMPFDVPRKLLQRISRLSFWKYTDLGTVFNSALV